MKKRANIVKTPIIQWVKVDHGGTSIKIQEQHHFDPGQPEEEKSSAFPDIFLAFPCMSLHVLAFPYISWNFLAFPWHFLCISI